MPLVETTPERSVKLGRLVPVEPIDEIQQTTGRLIPVDSIVENQNINGKLVPVNDVSDKKTIYTIDNLTRGVKTFLNLYPKYYGEQIDKAFEPGSYTPQLPRAEQKEGALAQAAAGVYNAGSGFINAIPTGGMLAVSNPVGLAYAAPHFISTFIDSLKETKKIVSNQDATPQQKTEALSNIVLATTMVAGIANSVPKTIRSVNKFMLEGESKYTPLINKIVPQETKPKTLTDVEKVFSALPDANETVVAKLKALPDRATFQLQNQFDPISVLEKQVVIDAPKLTLGDRFSLVAGAAGKAEAAIYTMGETKKSMIPDISAQDLNSFMFLRRTFDRLDHQEANPKLVRSVADWTKEETSGPLLELKVKLGDEKMARLELFAQELQKSADADMRLMVESGRMSEGQYATIKKTNDFYAPFKVMQYMADSESMAGSGRAIDTSVPLTQAITGITDKDFRLGDMFTAMAQNKYRAYTLAEKNRAMLGLAELTKIDLEGKFIRELPAGTETPKGFEMVNFMRDGVHRQLAVSSEVASAVKGLDVANLGIIGTYLGKAATPFKLGATGANIAFQIVNQVADVFRLANMSKYGVSSVVDVYKFPLDFLSSLSSSWKSNVFGIKDDLAMAYLNSGAAKSTIASTLSPETFTRLAQQPNQGAAAKFLGVPGRVILDSMTKVGNAIEETTKMMGVKRGVRATKWDTLSDAQKISAMDGIAYEVRNYAGSPDFAKRGAIGKELNLIFMFANARLQGAAADLRRLSGKTGTKEAIAAHARLATSVGLPTAAVWYFNQRPENEADFANRSKVEKQNYWLIPRYGENDKPLYFENESGEQVREYWRIPKRDIMASVSATIEGGLEFAKSKDPEALVQAGVATIENLSPFTITGKTFGERLESTISGVNPLLKAPIEMALNRNTGLHRPIVSDRLQKASPGLQTTNTMPPAFNRAAQAMPDFMPNEFRSPLHLRQLTGNLSGSLITQFMKQPQEGRSKYVDSAILGRFFSSPFNNNDEDWNKINKLTTQATDRSILKTNEIDKFINEIPKNDPKSNATFILNFIQRDPKNMDALGKAITDSANGVTAIDRAVRALPNKERASFIMDKLDEIPGAEAKRKYLNSLLINETISKDTVIEILELKKINKP